MEKKLQLRKLALGLLSLAMTFSVFAASTPTADDGKWYYVKSQRYNKGPWWTFYNATDKYIEPGVLAKTDAQKFTLVTSSTGKVTVKEFGGLKMTPPHFDNTPRSNFDATGATTGWTITSNVVDGVQGYTFPGENEGLHQGGAWWDWRVGAGWYDITDFCTFFFYEDAPNLDLNIAIDAAKEFSATVVVGTTLGTYSQSAVDAFNAAITTAEGNLTSTDATVLANSVTALNAAKTTLLDSKIAPVTSSTAEAPVWYLIKNVGRSLGETLYANGMNAQLKCSTTPVLADGTGTDAAAPALKYLFRFEIQADKSYKIVNALYPNGEVLQTSSGGSSSQAIKYGTATGVKYNIVAFAGASNPSTQFKIVSTGAGTIWHDDGGHNLVSWDAPAGSASAWYFEEFTGSLGSMYAPALQTSITDAEAAVNNSVNGSDFGQIPEEAKTTLLSAIADAQAIFDNSGSKTGEEIMAAKTTLDAAVVTYKAAMITAKSALLSTNPKNYRWYRIKNRNYATNDVITTNGILTDGTGGIICQNGGTSNDEELWRFEMNANQTSFKLVNKASGMAIKDNGTSTQATLVTLENATEFDLSRQDMYWAVGRVGASQYQYLHRDGGSKIVGWEAGSWATQWIFLYVEETENLSAGIESLSNETLSAYAVNGTIIVSGAANFNVYTVTGQKVRNKGLKQGVYLVKTASKTLKVTVK